MKKLAIVAVLALAAGAASAAEIGLRATHTPNRTTDSVGVTLGQKFGAVGAEVSVDRSTRDAFTVNKFGAAASYDVGTFAGVTVAPKIGVTFIDPSNSATGFAVAPGVVASYPLTKKVSLVADYSYAFGQKRVSIFNGNQVSVGAKYSF